MRNTQATVKHIHHDHASTECSACASVTNLASAVGHRHHETSGWFNTQLMLIIGSTALLAAAFFADFSLQVTFGIYLASYLLVGGEILYKAVRNIFRGNIFDEHFLMSIATIGAFVIGEYLEGVAVMLFFQIGEYFQDLAVDRSKRSISALLNIRPDSAHLQTESGLVTVSPERVRVGDLVVVKPGERVPLDGVVMEGTSALDTSALTGESVPRSVKAGDQVFSGSINTSGLLTIKVTKDYQHSTATRIIELVQGAASRKAPTENFITKFSRYYTPAVVLLALALAFLPPLLSADASLSEWSYRALVFLIISCPCALVVSIPLSFFGGIGAASRHGILVKGSNYLEAFNDLETVAFDKTGTLTMGQFKVNEIAAEGLSEAELLEYAAYAESYSNHPIAKAIRDAYQKPIDQNLIRDYQEIAGHGITAVVKDQQVIIGNRMIMDKYNIIVPDVTTIGSIVYTAVNGQYKGYIIVADQIKPDSAAAVAELKKLGIKNLVMLSGDRKEHAEAVANELGIEQVHAELLPQDKVELIEGFLAEDKKLAFIGDGINDAPVLARSDIGIAMGGLGSDAAIEAADVVFMTDEVGRIGTSIRLAKYTRRIVWQNIGLALGIKGLFLLLGALGMASLWEAVFADVGVTIIAVINASRALRAKA
jgi:Cd2+/Zn2+-exporting ATPase